jgi:hypothetical protein
MAGLPDTIGVRRIAWTPGYRIVPTRHPTVYLFDRVADAQDFDALHALESMTNDRLRDETGEIALVPESERIFGPGTGPIMAAFTHLNPDGSRFSDGSFGVFYAARAQATAVEETRFHHGRFFAATAQAPMHVPMRLYTVTIQARLHDLRGRAIDPAIHAPNDYSAARALGASLRRDGSAGVVYRSVRHPGGTCAGLFTPRGARDCREAAVLLYRWNGSAFDDIYERIAGGY